MSAPRKVFFRGLGAFCRRKADVRGPQMLAACRLTEDVDVGH
jgi:hypothetical protein